MAPLQENSSQRNLILCLLLLFITSTLISAAQSQNHHLFSRTRLLLELEDDDTSSNDHHESIIIKKKSTTTKNQTKLIKPSSNSPKHQTKLIKPSPNSSKNQTKLIKPSPNSSKNHTKLTKTSNLAPKNQTKPIKTSSLNELKNQTKPNKSSNLAPKNQTKLVKSPSDSSKNKTYKPIKSSHTDDSSSTQTITKSQIKKPSDQSKIKKAQKQQKILEEEEEDLVSEFTDLPSRFQETFLPDMERISKTSKIYLNKYNSQFTKGFKPYVGNKYASTLASIICFAFIIIPLILVSLLFSKITAYFSLQKFLIFIQIYLSIYFTILALSSLITGLEPLKLFYTTSHSTYVCVQVLQSLAYVLYLLLLLMYLVLVFSTESGAATKLLGLGQTVVGFAVGLHYYITVFHRAVLHQPPKASWKVHAIYATCFVVICLLGRVDRRKKAYLEEGGQEGKKS